MNERDLEPDGERRPLTVVFSDLVRSTGISATIDDEDFVEIMDRYYAVADEVFTSHGGYVAQHQGDGVFVWFGYPVAREDDADRAVAASVELIERILDEGAALESRFGVHIAARIGIHSGSAVVRALPGGGVTAFGFAVNFAAKVEAVAPIGGVVLSEATLELMRVPPEVRPAGDIAIEGAEGTIHLFHVLGGTPTQQAPTVRSFSPLVGRDRERTRLLAAWEHVAERGSTVVLAGTAGIGKTRLALELARVAARDGRLMWFRCDRYHEAVSFWPVRGAVLALAGLTETDRDEQAATKVQRMIERDQPATAAALTRALGLATGDTQAPEVDARRAHNDALDGFATFLRGLATNEPMMLVVEDLQFGDPSTTELVGRLAAVAHRGLLIVVTTRTEGQGEAASRLGTCIELRPLDDTESARLLDLLDPALAISDVDRKRLIDVAGGIPLFLEALVYEHARTDVAGIRRSLLSHSAVPVVLQQPILARIEGANVDSSVTKAAAVIGNRFSLDVLREVVRWPDDDLESAMTELCRLELIVPAGGDAYEFSHPLIRDLAYDMLVAESRARLHSATADALARGHDSDPAVLALHYERGGRFAEAIDAGLRAGAAARDSGAYLEAETMLTRTIALLNGGHGGADRDDQLLLAHQHRGFFRVATSPDVYRAGDEDYHESIELLRRHKPGPDMLWTLAGQWADAMFRGRLDDAVEMLDLFRSIAVTSLPEAMPANTAGYGMVATVRADYREAKRLLEEALAQIERDGWPDTLVRKWATPDYPPVAIRAHLFPVLMMLGDTSAARRMASEAEEIAGGLPWPVGPFSMAYAKAYQAASLGVVGDGATVMALGNAIHQIGSERGFEFWEKLGLLHVAVGGAQMFPNDMTIGALEMTLEALKASGAEALTLPHVSNAAATALLATGDCERALAVLEEAITMGRSKGIRWNEPDSLRLRAEALDGLGRDGGPDLQAAIELAREQHAILYALRALLVLVDRDLTPDEHRSCREAIVELLAQVPGDSDLVEVVRARELIRA